ncbi:hypothetical protein D9M71_732650 [compost metagenome]
MLLSSRAARILPSARKASTASTRLNSCFSFLRAECISEPLSTCASSQASAYSPASARFLRDGVSITAFSLRNSVARDIPSSAQALV